MNKILTILLILSSILCYSQTKKLDNRFQDLSFIIDQKSSEIITTLSLLYGNDSLKNDSNFTTIENYNLYYDSLSLWYITSHNNYGNSNKPNAKSTVMGNGWKNQSLGLSQDEELMMISLNTKQAYFKNNKSTIGNNMTCIPTNWENLKLFYKEESDRIKSYNEDRIRSYSWKSEDVGHNDYVISVIYYHKTIKPQYSDLVSFGGFSDFWIPYAYYYKKPKIKVYPANIEKIWTSVTGLPFNIVNDLNIDTNKIVDILKNKSVPNYNIVDIDTKNIFVNCDTCEIIFYDDETQDNDIINYIYLDEKETIKIRNEKISKQVEMKKSSDFIISSVSQGTMGLCTVSLKIDGVLYSFNLKKDEVVKIKLDNKLNCAR